MARQGQDNKMSEASQFIPFLTALYINTLGELGHQVAHKLLTSPEN